MADLGTPDLLQRFYDEVVKHKFPHVSLEQSNNICRTIFNFIKKKMEEPELPSIRLKYFGLFSVHKKKREHIEEHLETAVANKRITERKIAKVERIVETQKILGYEQSTTKDL